MLSKVFEVFFASIYRALWLTFVFTSITYFVVQVGQRTSDYFKYATNVDVKVIYTDKLRFPAVTLCNQNNFRLVARRFPVKLLCYFRSVVRLFPVIQITLFCGRPQVAANKHHKALLFSYFVRDKYNATDFNACKQYW